MSTKYTLQELATLTNATLIGDPSYEIRGVEALESATSYDVSFLANALYREAMRRSAAGAIFLHPSEERVEGKRYLLTEDPSSAFQQALSLFLHHPYRQTGFQGIHPTAVVHPSVEIAEGVCIGPYVTIDQGSKIGAYTQIFSHVSIGPGCLIGTHCIIHPHVTIRELCILKDRVVVQPGAVIGSCGFGFSTNKEGKHTKLDQLGIVEISDDVEIGANTTIDRARFQKTIIGEGTKIDNLVQIGHNVHVGAHNIIVAQTGISGSAKTGRNVILGGQCGVTGHLEVPAGTIVASRGGISKTLKQAGTYSGAPVLPIHEYNRQQVHLRKIETYVRRLEALEKKIDTSSKS